MFTLKKSFRFEASHQLKNHKGKCARLHGHSWEFIVEIEGEIDKNNMVIDYAEISEIAKPLIDEKLDHWHLNDTLNSDDPTSEYVSKWLYNYLKPHFTTERYKLIALEVKETCTSGCRY